MVSTTRLDAAAPSRSPGVAVVRKMATAVTSTQREKTAPKRIRARPRQAGATVARVGPPPGVALISGVRDGSTVIPTT